MRRLAVSFLISVGGILLSVSSVWAANVPIHGTAELYNSNTVLDFSGHNSNVTIDSDSGVLSGYAWNGDLGWVAFGSTDNPDGPVSVDLSTGKVSGVALVLNTGEKLDFAAHNSAVTLNTESGKWSGYVFSTNLGWIHFDYPGVVLGTSWPTPTPTPTSTPTPTASPTKAASGTDKPTGISLPGTGAVVAGVAMVGYLLVGTGVGLRWPWRKRKYEFEVNVERTRGRGNA